jgi:alpha-L-fucosidase
MLSPFNHRVVRRRQPPPWFRDAKLGLFIHWGLYSVPAWAPPRRGLEKMPLDYATYPYAEWYANSMRLPGSPTRRHHEETYGPDFAYAGFVPRFVDESARADPGSWVALAKRVGARYVTLTTKHHDGFCLWPSAVPHPQRPDWRSQRDFVGELVNAGKASGVRVGLYYSGIWDWSFGTPAIEDMYSVLTSGDGSHTYADYCYQQYRELIDRYHPDILWNDIGYPTRGRLSEVLAHYYASVPEGVANDRWFGWRIPQVRLLRGALRAMLRLWDPITPYAEKGGPLGTVIRGDYATPEYTRMPKATRHVWESVRGLGSSFGYNQNETEEHMLTGQVLIQTLADVVSKNGNLSIGIGPRADGSLPEAQEKPLSELGAWLAQHGDAVYGSRPWLVSEGQASDGGAIRFTAKDEAVYAFFLDGISTAEIAILGFERPVEQAVLLASPDVSLPVRQEAGRLVIRFPHGPPPGPVPVLRL